MDKHVFSARRQRLLEQMSDNSVALIAAAPEQVRSNDTHYPFRQDSNFFYLTGFTEPQALLLLRKGQTPQAVLFNRAKDPLMETWEGRRLGQEAAIETLGIDQALPYGELATQLPALLSGFDTLYYANGAYADIDALVLSTLETLRGGSKKGLSAPGVVSDLRMQLNKMRLVKDEAEIEAMRYAAQVSAEAHKRAMQKVKPGMFEYQLEAEIHHEFARKGCRHPAYDTIVGGGDNACILHYTENDAELLDGDLVLIDAGAEFNHYAGDITRTFPVNGKFSADQRALYDVVLRALHAASEVVRPGRTLAEANAAALRELVGGMVELGIMNGEVDELIDSEAYKPFYMHGIGHWLGIDVHDVGPFRGKGQEHPFATGMALTIEPGIYIAPDADVAPRWQGIGIRIEDNLLVTENGHENLTTDVPKNADAIEALMAG